MATEKFSQFSSGGLLKVGSSIVGLNANVTPNNTKFDFPGTGILDSNNSYLVGWSNGTTPGIAANYINIENGVSGTHPVIRATGSDIDVGLTLTTKGVGSIFLIPGGSGNVEAIGNTAFVVPVGTTAQRPAGTAGALRYNTDVGLIEFYDAVGTTWLTLSSSAGISSITGTLNRINISGAPTNPIIDISSNYVGQSTIAVLGSVTTGSWMANLIDSEYGGTGVNNAGKTITLGGNLVTSGAFASTFTMTGATNVTFPTSGTLATTAGTVASVTSANAARITIGGTSTNPTVNISATYAGQNTITTVGALSSGSLAPGFTPVPVSIGGTGVAAISAYSVVCGGTTGTGNLQNVVGVGTAGQGLLSNGAGALPSWDNVVTNIATGRGLSGGPITSSGTINIVVNNFCCGRLTLTNGVPVTTGDVSGATVVYFAPYNGNFISLYNGSTWDVYSFGQISIPVPGVANTMYDVFIFNNLGVVTFTLVAWTNDVTRATPIVLQDGIYCQSGTLTNRYVGSFRTTGVAGQTEDSLLKRYVYNYYNRVDRAMRVTTATASWAYTLATFRQANNSAANQVEFVCGVVEERLNAAVSALASTSAANRIVSSGIGINSTSVNSAVTFGSVVLGTIGNVPSVYRGTNYSVGRNFITWLEFSNTGGTTTWFGTGVGLTGFNSGAGLTANILM